MKNNYKSLAEFHERENGADARKSWALEDPFVIFFGVDDTVTLRAVVHLQFNRTVR